MGEKNKKILSRKQQEFLKVISKEKIEKKSLILITKLDGKYKVEIMFFSFLPYEMNCYCSQKFCCQKEQLSNRWFLLAFSCDPDIPILCVLLEGASHVQKPSSRTSIYHPKRFKQHNIHKCSFFCKTTTLSLFSRDVS